MRIVDAPIIYPGDPRYVEGPQNNRCPNCYPDNGELWAIPCGICGPWTPTAEQYRKCAADGTAYARQQQKGYQESFDSFVAYNEFTRRQRSLQLQRHLSLPVKRMSLWDRLFLRVWRWFR